MSKIIEPFVSNILNREYFTSYRKNLLGGGSSLASTALIISIIISQVLFLVFGKWLWNSFLVPCVTVIKPVNSIGHLLGISILIKLLFN